MFSALVAAVLIMTSVVLVTTMTTTEDKLGSQLYYMLNTFQLNDAAAIARSDALQSFNYNFRSSMQDYLTFNDSEMDTEPGFNILTTTNHNNWDEIINTFEKVILLHEDESHNFDAVIEFVANRTILQFNEGSYGRYHVSLSSKNQDARQNTINALNEAIDCLATTGEDFLEVIDCDQDSCELGTFYFNIPLDCISDSTYENLPKIVVKDLITKGETKLPILPKTRLKIYIPLRFFKAIFVARQNAEAMQNVEEDFRNAQLGFCDTGCNPRQDLNTTTSGPWSGHECPGGVNDNEIQTLSRSYAGLGTYNAGGGTVANIGLNAYAKQNICNNAIANEAWKTGDLEFYNISGPDYYSAVGYGVNGLEPDISGLIKINACPFKKILASVESAATKIISGSRSGKLYCGKMRSVEADVAFEERNSLYTVKGENVRYKIRITTDTFDSPVAGTQNCTSGTGSGGSAKVCKP